MALSKNAFLPIFVISFIFSPLQSDNFFLKKVKEFTSIYKNKNKLNIENKIILAVFFGGVSYVAWRVWKLYNSNNNDHTDIPLSLTPAPVGLPNATSSVSSSSGVTATASSLSSNSSSVSSLSSMPAVSLLSLTPSPVKLPNTVDVSSSSVIAEVPSSSNSNSSVSSLSSTSSAVNPSSSNPRIVTLLSSNPLAVNPLNSVASLRSSNDSRTEARGINDEGDRKIEARESKSEKEEKSESERERDGFLPVRTLVRDQSEESVSEEDVWRKIQIVHEALRVGNVKLLAEILRIDLSNYDQSGPMLFYQIFLENYQWLINFIKSNLNIMNVSLNKEILQKKLFQLNALINEIYTSGPWYRGREIVNLIIHSKPIDQYKATWEEHWKSIACIVWYFYEIAIEKKQKFIESTFNIEGKAIFDFIVSYKYAYDRSGKLKSSHYHEIDKPKFGLNIPTDKRNQWTYPNNKVHLLVGDISGPHLLNPFIFLFFLKPETYPTENPEPGTHNFDGLKHCGEWMGGVGKKVGIGGSDDEDYMRKERVPAIVMNAFEKLYYVFFPGEKAHWFFGKFYNSKPERIEIAAAYGIKAMLRMLNAFPLTNEIQEKTRKEFMELINDYDHLTLRKGREVILTLAEIVQDLLRKRITIS